MDAPGAYFDGVSIVETLHNGQWHAICDRGWDPDDAKVVCTELGYPLLVGIYDGFALPAGGGVYYTNLDCFGDETSLSQCQYEVDNGNCTTIAGVLCMNGMFDILRKFFYQW